MVKKSLIVFLAQLFLISFAYAEIVAIPAPPVINTTAYLLQDFNSGRVIAGKNIDQRLAPASLTKIMTAYVVGSELMLGRVRLDDEVLISEVAWRKPGSRMFIEVGRKVSVSDLLYGTIIQSGNDSSVALAEYVAGSEEIFARLMNQHAQQLGMSGSHFTNSTGLPDPQHFTTAKDIAILASALIRDMPDIYQLHSIKEFTFNNITQKNRNKLLWYDDDIDGIKTGHTESAGFCLVASSRKENMRLISVVMGAKSEFSRTRSTQLLLNYGFRFYETQKIYSAKDNVISVKVWKGDTDLLKLGVIDNLYITFPRGQREELTTQFNLAEKYIAPMKEDSVQGRLSVSFAGNELAHSELIALHSVDKGSISVQLKDSIKMFFEW